MSKLSQQTTFKEIGTNRLLMIHLYSSLSSLIWTCHLTSNRSATRIRTFFLSNLLHEDSFSWSKTFLSSDIPSALMEPETETHPFVIPRKCPDDKFLDSVLSEESADDASVSSDLASSPPKLAVVESDLRRSKRLRDARAGFRQGSCQKKNCLICQHKFEGPPPYQLRLSDA
jgi:hypothetical protein